MKFQWYIIDLEEGTVKGTNDVEQCDEFLKTDQYVVLTGQHGIFYLGSRIANEVEALEANEEEPDDGGD